MNRIIKNYISNFYTKLVNDIAIYKEYDPQPSKKQLKKNKHLILKPDGKRYEI